MDIEPPDPATEEGDAAQLLRLIGREQRHHVDCYDACADLEICASPRTPRGCAGFTGKLPKTIHVRQRGSLLEIQQGLRHEFGHIAVRTGGRLFPHEETRADRVGLRFEIPRFGILDAFDLMRRDLVQLAQSYPLVTPSDVYQRLAWALGWNAVFRIGRRRVPPANDNETLEAILRENALLDAVLATGCSANDSGGALAVPYKDPGRRPAVAILFPRRSA